MKPGSLVRWFAGFGAYVGTIPAELQPGHSFAGAVSTTSRQPEAASALLRFLAAPDAAPVITKAGLTPIAVR